MNKGGVRSGKPKRSSASKSVSRQAQERFRRFVDASIVGIVIAEASGALVEVNDYYLNTIGYTRDEFEKGLVNWRAITPSEWLPADERAIEELRWQGICTPYEKEYFRRDGTRVSVFISDALLPGPEAQIAAFVLNITERKRTEAALLERMDELQRFHDLTVGRELKMLALKKEINALLKKAGRPEKYRIVG